MKGVAVGDVLIPRDVMKKIYEQDVLNKLITKVAITELECKTRADIRTVWRKVEEHGPDGVEPPKDLELLIEDADIVAVHICWFYERSSFSLQKRQEKYSICSNRNIGNFFCNNLMNIKFFLNSFFIFFKT
jgi:hypothetical protein